MVFPLVLAGWLLNAGADGHGKSIHKEARRTDRLGKDQQSCIVTGATSGIGRAIALALSKAGTTLGLIGRNSERLEEVATDVRSRSGAAQKYRVDLGRADEIRKVAAEIGRDFEGIDVLIHSAGIFRMGTLAESPIADLELLYKTNVEGPYALTQAVLPMMKARRGQIVFINSSVGLTARAGVGAYAASKHALKAIADALRAEVNESGVRVISVYPGRTATPQQKKIHELEGRAYNAERLLQPEDVAQAVLNALAMPRTAEVTDIQIRPMRKL
ncbi:MAG: SDR family oxidoreductase [Candidatus Acidiferrum sp.]